LWFLICQPGAGDLPALFSVGFVLGCLLIGLLLTRIAINRNAPSGVAQLISLGGAAGAIALSLLVVFPLASVGSHPSLLTHFLPIPAWLVSAILVVLLWYRAQAIASDLITPMRTAFDFRLGIVMMIFAALIQDQRIHTFTLALLPLFFFAGLLATSLARLSSLYISRTVQRTTFSGRWLALNAGSAALVNGLGLLLATLLTGISLGGMSALLQQLLAGIGTILLAILYPVLVVIDAIASWLAEHLSSVFAKLQVPQIGNTFNTAQASAAPSNQAALVMILTALFKVILLALLFGAALLLLTRLLQRRETDKSGNDEEREHMASQNVLKGVGAALRHALSSLQAALPIDWLTGRRLLDAMSIRWQYARLAERAGALGFPRGEAETPFEYQSQLKQAFPGYEDQIKLVTAAYVNVHYGELPDNPQGFAAVKESVDAMLANTQEQFDQRKRAPVPPS
ncbi:MAG TPA: DUF4129 domain-containing protein, partial [Aggregatilineales bacterium]|nr:DUF4129 domain-containing protein [Aggregatilineales bacterium]